MLYDDASDTRNLLIYCLYGYEEVNKESWLDGIKALTKYAKSKKCNQIIAYTEYDYIINIVKSLGAETKFTFLSFDVNETIRKINDITS